MINNNIATIADSTCRQGIETSAIGVDDSARGYYDGYSYMSRLAIGVYLAREVWADIRISRIRANLYHICIDGVGIAEVGLWDDVPYNHNIIGRISEAMAVTIAAKYLYDIEIWEVAQSAS